jgi:hypothetical protein
MRVRAELATELNQSRLHVLRSRLLAVLSIRRMKPGRNVVPELGRTDIATEVVSLGQADAAPIRSKESNDGRKQSTSKEREGESTVIQHTSEQGPTEPATATGVT